MSVDQEREAVWRAIGEQTDRVTELREDMREMIATAVRDAMADGMLTDAHRKYLDLAIEERRQAVDFRRRVIESTLVGAVLLFIGAAITIVGVILRDFFVAHGWKV